MLLRHADRKLERLELEQDYSAGFDRGIVKAFRKVIQFIRAANDERDLYAMKSLRFEKLKGSRNHQRSLRLNDQFRLIVELEKDSAGNVVVVIAIEDYH